VEGHLRFEDGTPARFWSTNLVGPNIFCSHEQADRLADRLAKLGVNMLRLHNMDGPWARPNVFGNATTTRKLDPAQMEKVDYLIAALKKKGVYVYLDLLVHRDFLKADGVEDPAPEWGGKQVGFFAPRLIELQKEYAANGWSTSTSIPAWPTRMSPRWRARSSSTRRRLTCTSAVTSRGRPLSGDAGIDVGRVALQEEDPGPFRPGLGEPGAFGLEGRCGRRGRHAQVLLSHLQTKYLGTMTRPSGNGLPLPARRE
jgi:hypothetical protein